MTYGAGTALPTIEDYMTNPSTDDNIQVRYTFTTRAWHAAGHITKSYIVGLYDDWLKTGKTPAGVEITATVWGSDATQSEIREYLMRLDCKEHCPGIVDRYGDADVTLCDYDEPDAPPDLTGDFVRELAAMLSLTIEWVEYAPSKRGVHIATKWSRKFSPGEIVALQLLLGSDPHREKYNLIRVLSGQARDNPRWNLLFSRKI